MERIETFAEITDFITASPSDTDLDVFWDQLGLNPQVMTDLSMAVAIAFHIDPRTAIVCMMVGARLALRADPKLEGEKV